MAQANTYFFTGFPGFIASSLLAKMVRSERPIGHIYVLVLPNLLQKAKDEIAALAAGASVSPDLFTIVMGDITKPGLDIGTNINRVLVHEVTHVFHLAAVYDLAVPYDLAYQVNVVGTRNVNDWVLSLPNIRRYVYFSTAYVSGRREGRILESELQMHQTFKNHYESTKYEAEVAVQELTGKVPTTVIRPGIVKGNSKTGETIKFDGPYFMLNLLDRLSSLPVIPYLGKGQAEGNFVPVDYIFDAVLYLAHADAGIGKTYHLTDPRPYSMRDVYRMLMKEYLGKEPKGTLPLAVVKPFMQLPAVRKWLRVEKEGLDYFTCMAEYDCTQAQADLEGTGIRCPDFKETVGSMVAFYRKHKNDPDKQMKIT